MRTPPSSVRSIAAEQLYFFRKTRFCVPGASRMSNPCSRSQFTASSYVRFSLFFAISHLTRFRFPTQTHCCFVKTGRADNVAHREPFQQYYCWPESNPRPAGKVLPDSGEQEL